jgi:hypothetical protein
MTGSNSTDVTANAAYCILCAGYFGIFVCAGVVIPSACIVNNSVAVACVGERKISCLSNLVVPIVRSIGVHANEDEMCMSVNDFSLINAVTVFIGHIYPRSTVTAEEVNSESCAILNPFSAGLKVNYVCKLNLSAVTAALSLTALVSFPACFTVSRSLCIVIF